MNKFFDDLFNRFTLETKLVLIVSLIITATVGIFGLFGIQMIQRQFEDTLYQSMSTSSHLISYLLDAHLADALKLTDVLRADSTIQNHLDAVYQKKDYQFLGSYEAIYTAQQNHYQQYKKPYLTYSAIINPQFTTYTYSYEYEKFSPQMIEEMTTAAEAAIGSPVWFSQYTHQGKLYLIRQIRKIEHLELSNLGTLAIAIDMDELLNQITKESRDFPNIYWLFSEHDRIIYTSPQLEQLSLSKLRQLPGRYGILSSGGHSYFVLKGQLNDPDWDYFQLLPYDSMTRSQQLMVQTYLLALFFGLTLAIFLIHFSIRKITFHIRVLCQKMASFHGDNAEAIKVPYDYSHRTDEVGQMHQYFDSMASEIETLINNDYKLKLDMKNMQLKTLEAQINPHFLYNTLDSINWRARAAGNEDISIMVESLGTLLRSSLSQKNSLVPLKEELNLVQRYLAIQKIRYEERLSYSYHLGRQIINSSDIPPGEDLSSTPGFQPDDGLMDILLPPFSIQPLVENAIKYGLEQFPEECSIIIAITNTEDDTLHIQVKNDGSVFQPGLLEKLQKTEDAAHGLGIGLLNINQRIKLLFGREYGLALYNRHGFAIAEISIPITLNGGRYHT